MIDADEITWWMAYERVSGPLGRQYSDNMFAHIHEQLQLLCYMFGEVNFKDNPIPSPSRIPRPDDLYRPKEDEYVMDVAEFDTHFDD